MDLTITLSAVEVQVAQAMAPNKPVDKIAQRIVKDALAPEVARLAELDQKQVLHAYEQSNAPTRKAVRQTLGLPEGI